MFMAAHHRSSDRLLLLRTNLTRQLGFVSVLEREEVFGGGFVVAVAKQRGTFSLLTLVTDFFFLIFVKALWD